jgi:hypothetical protein
MVESTRSDPSTNQEAFKRGQFDDRRRHGGTDDLGSRQRAAFYLTIAILVSACPLPSRARVILTKQSTIIAKLFKLLFFP